MGGNKLSEEKKENIPDLTDRMAVCIICDKRVKSNINLQAFVFRGPGSNSANNCCKHCGYYKNEHDSNQEDCQSFEPNGPFDEDLFYCENCGPKKQYKQKKKKKKRKIWSVKYRMSL